MTLRHLRIFVAVAETGQMRKAAEQVFLSQPTVSQAISELEAHYDTLLFERLNRRLHITPSGQKLLLYAKRILNEFDSMEQEMRGEHQKKSLRIGATMTIGTCLLPSILKQLQQTIPDISLYSYVANTKTVEEQLLSGNLDIALVEGIVQSPDLITIPVIDDELVLACSNTHPLASQTNVDKKELGIYDFVMREQGSGTRSLFEHYLASQHLKVHIACESNSTEAIKNAIIENQYLAVISARLLENEIRKGELCIFHHEKQLWNRSFYLVYHKDKLFSEEMEQLKSLCHQEKIPALESLRPAGILLN